MSGMRNVWEVARRELVERSRTRAMRISMVLLLVLSVAGAVAAARLVDQTPTDEVAVVGERSVALGPALRQQAAAADREIELTRMASEAEATEAVRDQRVDVALIDGERLIVQRSDDNDAVRVVQQAVSAEALITRLEATGLSRDEVLEALTARPAAVEELDPLSREDERNRDVLYVALLVLYIALLGFGNAVAASVTEEKASRVIELLLTTVRPRELLAGKVLGMGLLGLGQLTLSGAAALIAGGLAGGEGLPSGTPETVVLVVVWFVLGYLFYSVVYAAIGALVSRQEDLSTPSMPVTVIVIASFIVAMASLEEPNGTIATVSAFVPPLSPMVVPSRVVLGDMGALGLAATIVLELAATALLIVLAARVYERAILRIGAPVGLRGVLRGDDDVPGGPGGAKSSGESTADGMAP